MVDVGVRCDGGVGLTHDALDVFGGGSGGGESSAVGAPGRVWGQGGRQARGGHASMGLAVIARVQGARGGFIPMLDDGQDRGVNRYDGVF